MLRSGRMPARISWGFTTPANLNKEHGHNDSAGVQPFRTSVSLTRRRIQSYCASPFHVPASNTKGVGVRVSATLAREAQHEVLLQRLADARAYTDRLFSVVRTEAFYDRPIPERHRIIFYVGHLEAFDWNLIGRGHFDLRPFSPEWDQLFSFGIDPVDGGLPTDQPEDWPRRADVLRYNDRLRELLDKCLETGPFARAGSDESEFNAANAAMRMGEAAGHRAEVTTLLQVAIEHRLMHAETLTYMLHQLASDKKIAQDDMGAPDARPATAQMVEIPAGVATLGLARCGQADAANTGDEIFGWDNEFKAQRVSVPAFRMDTQNVTNGEFLQFVNEGGYQDRALWSESDWEWLRTSGTAHPGFWIRREGARSLDWSYRTMFDERPLPLEWPVYVSHAEATAYARWRGKELPSEAEWHRAALGTPNGAERKYPWGDALPDSSRGNFDFTAGTPPMWEAFPQARARGAFSICWATGGNGRGHCLRRSRVSCRSRFTQGIRRIFLTESTTL